MPSFTEQIEAFRSGVFGSGAPEGVTARHADEIEQRFAVYRNNVFVSLTNALLARFPVITRLVGDEFAKAMFGVFARRYPPQSPMIMEYGQQMPAFLASFEPAKSIPYLADIARLEIARGRAYHSADIAALGPEGLAALPASDPESLVLDLHPSVLALSSRYPIFSIWDMNREGQTPVPIDLGVAQSVLVARQNMIVITRPIDPAEATFIVALQDGQRFASAVAAATEHDGRFNPTGILSTLIGAELIISAGV